MASKSTETLKATQFKLGQRTLDDLDAIADHYGFQSRAEALRMAARELAEKIRKKSRETA